MVWRNRKSGITEPETLLGRALAPATNGVNVIEKAFAYITATVC
jgi:hypothetical protein